MASAQRLVGKLAHNKPHFNTSESAIIRVFAQSVECMQKGAPRAGYEGKTGRASRNRQHWKE